MKKWANPEIKFIEISETAHKWTGIYRDGGYIGDGEISGHLSWCNPNPTPAPTPTPVPTPEPTPTPTPEPHGDAGIDGLS